MKDFQVIINAAVVRGEAEAEKDLKTGRFRIRACGKVGEKNEIDSVTGYRIERIGSCGQGTMEFYSELNAYNRTMRDWNAKHRKRNRSNPIPLTGSRVLQITAPTLRFEA
jgi:hypothetical protein